MVYLAQVLAPKPEDLTWSLGTHTVVCSMNKVNQY